ncbi:hypothetical protein [Streptomyces sp. NBC_01217]|uniref:hypothetical protein n=1 Tax=Streptomyces sp. NBC_01217 TaxID=2903779 RepID=UPI002E131F3D|nr:hypothetical protein OG507_37340 [Streptomyces sp. NBC_01217]
MLLDGNPDVCAALQKQLGFDGTDALAALNAMGDAVHDAMAKEHADNRLMELARTSPMSMSEPDADQATVAIDDIAAHTGITAERVRAVVERFRLDVPSHDTGSSRSGLAGVGREATGERDDEFSQFIRALDDERPVE